MTGTARCKSSLSATQPRTSATPADHESRSTFLKRKGGLFKKAHELSVLCSVDVAVFIFGSNKKLYEYSSGDMRELITRYTYVSPRSGTEHRRKHDG
jgi:transcription factor RLM1